MQKISFARAIIGNKELLILDESTTNLDTDSKEIIYKLFKNQIYNYKLYSPRYKRYIV